MKQEKENRMGTAVIFVLAVYAVSRMFYLISGSILARVVPTSSFQRVTQDVPFGSMNLWSHWDGEHYVMLAMSGYLNPPENVSPAFFPLYPLLARSSALLLGGPLSKEALSVFAPLLSLLLLLPALYFVYHIALDGWGRAGGQGHGASPRLLPHILLPQLRLHREPVPGLVGGLFVGDKGEGGLAPGMRIGGVRGGDTQRGGFLDGALGVRVG